VIGELFRKVPLALYVERYQASRPK
jgi:hypothetical protein